jgi:hypothetical protein
MSPTSTDLLEFARVCAEQVDLPKKRKRYPTFSEVEEQCEEEYDRLLSVLHEDEVFAPVDLDRQQALVDAIGAALTDEGRALLDELIDNHARHLWLQQEGAYFVGLAVGLRAAGRGQEAEDEETEEEDEADGDAFDE